MITVKQGPNPQIIEEWAQALESGEYTQGHSRLRNGDDYCCLGVLCELAVKAGVIKPPEVPEGGLGDWYYDGAISYPPASVREWVGIGDATYSDIEVKVHGETQWLANLNDMMGYPFKDIARVIRANFLPKANAQSDSGVTS